MTVKSIWQIDIQDSKVHGLMRMMERYQSALKETRMGWLLTGREIDKSRESHEKLVRSLANENEQAKQRKRAQEEADRLTKTTAERWQSMARSSSVFLANIREGAGWLLKWASISGIVSGVLGGGGLFGIDRLAASAASGRRSALGLGTSIGEQASFGNFGRLIDPASFLGSVAEARFDVNKRVGLLGAGLSQRQIDSGSTGQVAVTLLDSLKKIADSTNPALFAQVLRARRLDQFAGVQDLERLRNTSPQEYAQLRKQYGEGQRSFDLPDDVAKKWQDLSTQLDNAGKSIETTLIRGLVGLAPGISRLSDAVSKTFKTLLEGNGPVKHWLDDLGSGLERFASYIGTPEFQENVRVFVSGLGKIAEKIVSVVSYFGDPELQREHEETIARVRQLRQDRKEGRSTFLSQIGDIFQPNAFTQQQLLEMVGRKEGGTTGVANAYGAVGKYQIKPGTAIEHGIDPSTLYTAEGNEAAARKILRDYSRRYGGKIDEILAAYNQGTGAGDRYHASGGNAGVLKPEGQKYIQGTGGMKVIVEQAPGAGVNTSVNALKTGE